MTELTPSAQVVFDSYKAASDGWLQYESCQIAAALRAAALYCKRDALILLSLADELEAQQSIPPITMTDYKQLCVELVDELEGWIAYGDEIDTANAHELIDRARAALAEPEPEGPTRRQLMMLADDMDMASVGDAAEYGRAVIARWGNHPGSPDSSLQPISVSERLPGPEDCDREGNVWAWRRFDPENGIDNGDFWCLAYCEWLGDEDSDFTHWLPAHALPVPSHD